MNSLVVRKSFGIPRASNKTKSGLKKGCTIGKDGSKTVGEVHLLPIMTTQSHHHFHDFYTILYYCTAFLQPQFCFAARWRGMGAETLSTRCTPQCDKWGNSSVTEFGGIRSPHNLDEESVSHPFIHYKRSH